MEKEHSLPEYGYLKNRTKKIWLLTINSEEFSGKIVNTFKNDCT
jgi:hypothetical protein